MSTGVGMSSCCMSGSVHDGTPTGRVETIDGLQTYIAAPQDGSKAKTVIFLVDIFGWEFKNVRLLADHYAKAGLYCYIPDIHEGDSLPLSFLQAVEPPLKDQETAGLIDSVKNGAIVTTTLPPWLFKHPESTVKPMISSFIAAVRAIPGTGKVGAVGFCWGGRYTILAAHGEIDAGYACHPALVSIPGDVELITKPVSFALGTKDSLLDEKSRAQMVEVLEKNKAAGVPYEWTEYEKQIHGFALRGDWSSDEDAKAMDAAEKQGITWFQKYLA